jgi:hypothetical protein
LASGSQGGRQGEINDKGELGGIFLFLSGKVAVEALAARSGSTFVSWLWRLELDGIFFQNYGDIMVRLLCP